MNPRPRKGATSGTKEWADSNVNCVDGCRNDCRYCYAKQMAHRFGRDAGKEWKTMVVNIVAVNKGYTKRKGRIMFPTSHDLIPDDPSFGPCMVVLEKLLRAGNEVLVTTKPRLTAIEHICSTFVQFKGQIQFRFTITAMDDVVLKEWEPGAPSFAERLASLEHAAAAGFKTSISCEPALVDIAGIRRLYDATILHLTESFWIGTMNHCRGPVQPDPVAIYNAFKGLPLVRFKDSISKAIEGGNEG